MSCASLPTECFFFWLTMIYTDWWNVRGEWLMVDVRLNGIVTDDHRLVVELPSDIPPGEVEILIRTVSTRVRDSARAKLAAAGLLSSAHHPDPDMIRPTDAEVEAAGRLPPGARGSEELVDEDRGVL